MIVVLIWALALLVRNFIVIKDIYIMLLPVIMAGGTGSCLWPMSREFYH